MILINYINQLKVRLESKHLQYYQVLHFLRDLNLPKRSFFPLSSSFCNTLLRFLFQIYSGGWEAFFTRSLAKFE